MRIIHRRAVLRGSSFLGSLLLPLGMALPALAQVPAGLSSQAPATAGSTNVAKEGFQAPIAPAPDSKDGSSLKLTAGGFVSQGNSKTIAATAAADYFLRVSSSQFTAAAAYNYGRSAPAAGEPSETTVNNTQGHVRYDYFVTGSFAALIGVSARRDEFQQLDLRLNVDPGVAYYFIDDKAHRLWAELGYDFQYDIRRDQALELAAADPLVPDLDKHEVRHSARVFAGYSNQLADAVKFNADVEYLQDVANTENARLNLNAGVTSQINTDFSIAATASVKFDNNPLPGVESTDVITALSLVYTMLE